MKTNIALSLGFAALVGLAAAMPASAATTTTTSTAAKPAATAAAPASAKPTHYFVALKSKGPGCEVVEAKPTTKLMVGKQSYKSEADANKALAADKACKA
jgi:hypothetical protein